MINIAEHVGAYFDARGAMLERMTTAICPTATNAHLIESDQLTSQCDMVIWQLTF